MRIVDLRSDTVTLPTDEMLEAMRNAELGDDVYREDPTVNRLEKLAAKKMGKDAALLTTSGTQANLVSAMSQTTRGDEVILETEAHMYYYEVGAFSALGGLIPRFVKGHMGVMSPRDIEQVLRPPNIHFPPTSLICIENTHNRAGGTIWSPSNIKEVSDLAKTHGLRVHMDGARIFNAAIALGLDVREFTRHVDTLMFCLSKGLSAPIGSMVVGEQAFVDRARRYRKMLGGGMRQAGVIAAAGIIAIEKMVDRLRDDHVNAKTLAAGLSKIPGITVDVARVQTNIVVYDVAGLGVDGKSWVAELGKYGVKAGAQEYGRVRMVTHRGIEKEDIEYALTAVEKATKDILGKKR
ncbi:aminotransferase class I/II-fold pyridoxal phosphate-dependent enzyme [Candidatus Bathyarchaeota archaeon]|nr:aminotransferase class I/II-fold pyridoxal phosphate-dependent enzyme [Candidatus Bathyarchaeota archaeon]